MPYFIHKSIILLVLISGITGWVIVPYKSGIERINGACIVNPPRPIDASTLGAIKQINVNWVAVIPYGFSHAGQPNVSYDHSGQWWGERTDGNCKLIQYAKENHLKVMVKPHVWVIEQGWAGDFSLTTEGEWKTWEKDYTKYILNHASKADSMNAELFCIGTEYRVPARDRPQFWRDLIGKVRKHYSGKITYASNWDNYHKISWWDAVDYIGIDAYFPLAEGVDPSVEKIKEGWEPVKKNLSVFSNRWKKPILFTEFGFQSIDGATGKHWDIDKSVVSANPQLQADAFEATFQSLENASWFVGGFFWKWHLTSRTGDWYKKAWTPQNKPASEVIAKWYGKS